jgi:hypothetical protein
MKIRIFQGGEVNHLIPTKTVKYSRVDLKDYMASITKRIDNRVPALDKKVLLRREGKEVYIVDGHFRLAAYYLLGYRLLLTCDYEWENNGQNICEN